MPVVRIIGVIIALLIALDNCKATIDPSNATTIQIDNLQFNITHDYWRTRFLLDHRAHVNFWINPYELPEYMMLYEDGHWRHITKTETMHSLIVKTTKRVFNDWNIDYRRMLFANYYREIAKENDYLRKKPLYPLHRHSTSSSGYPLLVHFRYKPYPQSNFGEFVSNRAIGWRVWHNYDDYIVSDYVGAEDDLLYRMRHNVGHSMGLGHTTSKLCVMHPTNVRYLASLCSEEMRAMRALLTIPRIVDDGY